MIDVCTGVDTGRATYRHSTDTSLLPGEREVLTACAFHYNFYYRPKASEEVTF